MLLLTLLGCDRSALPPCGTPRTAGWQPETEDEVRVDEATAAWEDDDGAPHGLVEGAACSTPPCLVVAGGRASTPISLNRGVAHRLTATAWADTAARVVVRQRSEDGSWREVAALDVDGPTDVDLAFTPDGTGDEGAIVFEAAGAGSLDELSVQAETWSRVDADGHVPVLLGFLIHVEADGRFLVDEERWSIRARLVEGLAATLGAHGARLGLQPDVTFISGAESWEPGWLATRGAADVSYSLHVHGEEEGEPTDVADAIRRARGAFEAAGLDVTDMNGGFSTGAWGRAAGLGVRSVSAYKDPVTQESLPAIYTQPWRPAEGAADAESFVAHDDAGPVTYIPGSPVREVEHARVPEFVDRVVSQVHRNAREGFVNTWYFVLHVDNFLPQEDEAQASYVAGDGLAADLAHYDRMLTEVLDPLVAAGLVTYSDPAAMAAASEAWEAACQ